MYIKFRCKCGLLNHNVEDWICHFKYRGFFSGIKNFLLTKMEFNSNSKE